MNRIRRRLALLLVAVLTLAMLPVARAEHGGIHVLINDQPQAFEQEPIIQSDRTLVPMRAIFEALGAELEWNGVTRAVTATRGDRVIELTIGQMTARVNGEPVDLEVPAQIVADRTFVPLRFVAQALGAEVGWDAASRTILIALAPLDEPPGRLVLPEPGDNGPALPRSGWQPGLRLPWGEPVSLAVTPEHRFLLIPGEPAALPLYGPNEAGALVALPPDAPIGVLSPGWEFNPETREFYYSPDDEGNPQPLTIRWGEGRTQTIQMAWLDPGPAVSELLAEMEAVNAEIRIALAEAQEIQALTVAADALLAEYTGPLRRDLEANGRAEDELKRRGDDLRRRLRANEERWQHLLRCRELYQQLAEALAALRAAMAEAQALTGQIATAEQAVAGAEQNLRNLEALRDQAEAERDARRDRLDQAQQQRDAYVRWLTRQVPGAWLGAPGGGATGWAEYGRGSRTPTPDGEAINFDSEGAVQEWLDLVGRHRKRLDELKAAEDAAQAEFDAAEAEYQARQVEVDAAQQALDGAQAALTALRTRLEQASRAVDGARAKVEAILAALERAGCPAPDLDGGLEQAEAETEQLDEQAQREQGATALESELLEGELYETDRGQREAEEEERRLLDEIRAAEAEAKRKAAEDERKRLEEAERKREAAAAAAARALERHQRSLAKKLEALRKLKAMQEEQGNGDFVQMLEELEQQLADMQESGVTEMLPADVSEKLEKLKGRLEQLNRVIRLIERANRPDLTAEERAKALADAYELARSLAPDIPGISDFLDFYGQALAAIAEALGKIERSIAEGTLRSGLDCEDLLIAYPGNQVLMRACETRKLLQAIRDP